MMENSLLRESSAPVSSIQKESGSNFNRSPKPWTVSSQPTATSWGDLRIEPHPLLRKMMVTFTSPLLDDIDFGDIVTLPATRKPVKPAPVYALAVNRYNKLVLSESETAMARIADAAGNRDDVLVGDASCAVSSAVLSGRYASELLERATFLAVDQMEDGEYARTQFGQSVVVIHREGERFWLHFPEALTEYFCEWLEAATSIERE
jgi:hypothetical protein